MDVYARVAGIGVDDQRPGGSETVCVLVENDVTLILDELFDGVSVGATGWAGETEIPCIACRHGKPRPIRSYDPAA